MPIRTIKKAKSTKTCRNCKGNVAGSASECQNCGSSDLAKSLILIRKSEATGEESSLSDADLETASETSESDDVEDIEDEDELEDLEEEDFEPAEDDEESDDEDEDDEDDDDESEDESDEDEEEEPTVTKRVVRRRVAKSVTPSDEILADIALVALTAVDDISKSLGDKDEYEVSMADLNNAMDAVYQAASSGRSISKEDKAAKLARLRAKLKQLKAMAAKGGDDDDEDVEKSDDIFAGLTPQAAEIVRKSQELIEKNTNEQFETIAKSYGELPISTVELGGALRFLSEHNSDAYTAVTKALGGAAEAVNQSAIFKSFGSPQTGEATTGQTLEAITKSFQDANPSLTPEQALVEAMQARPDLYAQSLRG